MKKRSVGIAGPLLLCVLAPLVAGGCSNVAGHWSLTEVSPTAAQRDVEFRTLTLHDDGSFYAEAVEGKRAVIITEEDAVIAKSKEGPIRTVSGTYTFDEESKTLTLVRHDGERATYDAQLKRGGKELQLLTFWEGQKLKLIYERGTT
jgi:hypothetical protein